MMSQANRRMFTNRFTRRNFLQMAGVATGSAIALPLLQGCVLLDPTAQNVDGVDAGE